jgi:glycerophosphoryl diester phosphodiesterase
MPRSFFVLICILGLTWAALAQVDGPGKVRLSEAARRVKQTIGHRGSCADRPENTMASYRRGIEAGATAVECDLRTTRDGILVSSHDADLFRTTGTKALIKDLTLDELRRLDAGSWFDKKYKGERISTFREILELCKALIDLVLDLKETGDEYAERVAADVRRHGDPRRIIVGVRSVEQARAFRKLLPEARQLALIPTPESLEAFAAAKVEMVRLWPKWLGDDKLVARVRGLGLQLHLNGTTGALEEVRELLHYQPESLTSDDPAQLVRSLKTLADAKDR